MIEKLETDIATLTYQNNVMYVDMKEGIYLEVDNFKELLHQAVSLAKHKKYYAIIDNRKIYDISSEARGYYSDNEYTEYRLADALIINSLAMRLLANFFIRFNQPKIPTKLFENEEKAYEWINKLKAESLSQAS